MKTTDFIKESQIADDAHVMHVDHEIQMAREECYHSAANAIKLHKLLKQVSEQDGIDAWASEKITLANDYLRTVCEWLEYELMSKNSEPEMAIPAAFDEESAEQMIARALSETTEVSKKNQQNLDKNPWAGIGFDVRSDYLWPAMMFESTKEGSEFSQWIGNYKQHLSSPKDNAKCILAMANKMSDKIIIFYGIAEYVGEDSNSYVLKINSGTHEYSKNNQLVFASSKDFEHFKTTLALKFGEIPIKTKKMPVMETSRSEQGVAEGFTNNVDKVKREIELAQQMLDDPDSDFGTRKLASSILAQAQRELLQYKDTEARYKGVAEGLKSMYHNAVADYHGRKADDAFDNGDEEGFKKSMDKNISHKLKAGEKIPQVRDAKKFQQGVAEGLFGIDDNIKGRIQNIVSDLSDIPGMWDHKAQTFTDAGMDKLKTVLKNNPKYIKYALNLDYKDYEAEGVAEGLQKINWVKPNFDFEWHEVEEQSKMKQVPVDVRQYYQKHFPNKDAWLKAVQNGKAVVVPPDHAYEIRNAPFDKAALQKVLAPTGHEGPIGPAKEKRVNDLFDKGQVEMPIILKTSQGLWLIGGKTRLGTANYVKGLPAKVWLIGGKQGVAEEWSQKYKSSINCSHPKGFSQKAHCAGKKKHNESIEMEVVCPDCGMCEAHGNSKIYNKCWTGFRKVPGKKRGEEGSCEKIGEDADASSSSSVSIAAAPPQNLFKKPIKRTTKK